MLPLKNVRFTKSTLPDRPAVSWTFTVPRTDHSQAGLCEGQPAVLQGTAAKGFGEGVTVMLARVGGGVDADDGDSPPPPHDGKAARPATASHASPPLHRFSDMPASRISCRLAVPV